MNFLYKLKENKMTEMFNYETYNSCVKFLEDNGYRVFSKEYFDSITNHIESLENGLRMLRKDLVEYDPESDIAVDLFDCIFPYDFCDEE
jgi:hypothetical protein